MAIDFSRKAARKKLLEDTRRIRAEAVETRLALQHRRACLARGKVR